MVIRIHKKSPLSTGQLDYNRKKFEREVADIVASNKLRKVPTGLLPSELAIEISRLEKMCTRSNIKYRSFHMTIDPDLFESLSDKQAKELTQVLMLRLGFKDQPWILYKHKDIDREHYHIVSTRATEKGILIPSNRDRYIIQEVGREMGLKMGFVIGKAHGEEYVEDITRFNPKGALIPQFNALLDKAMKYTFRDFNDFVLVMRSLGVKVEKKHVRLLSTDKLLFQGLDYSGEPCTKTVKDIDKINRELGYSTLIKEINHRAFNNQRLEPGRLGTYVEKMNTESIFTRALNAAEGKRNAEAVFFKYMNNSGRTAQINRYEDGTIEDIRIVDPEIPEVFHFQDLELHFGLELVNQILPQSATRYRKDKEKSLKEMLKETLKEDVKSIGTDVKHVVEENLGLNK